MIPSLFACKWTSDDVNSVTDNAFKNYTAMNNTESGSYSKFKDINVQSSYLGYGYDVINDPYMDSKRIAVSYPILDMEKIDSISLQMQKLNSGNFNHEEGSTIEEFYNDYAASINVYGKANKFFSGGLKLDFSGSSSEKTYWRFYKLYYYWNSFSIHITNTVDQLQSYLSESFKNDLINLPVEALFDRYGTHLIKEAMMGGRIEKNLTYFSTSANSKESMDTAVNTHIKIMKASINAEASASANSELSQSGVECRSNVTQLGGKAISLAGDIDYDKWASSFDESLEYAALCGTVSENSLVGIWNLLPSGYENRATEIENKFIELCNNEYLSLCEKFKLAESEAVGQSWNKLTYKMNRHATIDGKHYNKTNVETNTELTHCHDGFELGELNLYGCKEAGDTVVLKNKSDFSIKYHLLHDYTDLPIPNDYKEWANTYRGLIADSESTVNGTNINSTVGYGAYYVRITYKDDDFQEFNKTNFLQNVNADTHVELVNYENLKNKEIKKVEVVVVYELWVEGNAFLWWRELCSNWRCEYTFNFA